MTEPARPIRIYGITGGIGSGKSAVAERFARQGIPVIDADKVGHEILVDDAGARTEIVEAFGEGIVAGGEINREKLGSIVFGNDPAMKRLNAIMHPRIYERIARRIARYAEQGRPAVVVDAAILAESGKKEPWLDGLILVLSTESTRAERLVRLRNMALDEALRRIRAQTPPEFKMAAADWVIKNDGTLATLHREADIVAKSIKVAVEK